MIAPGHTAAAPAEAGGERREVLAGAGVTLVGSAVGGVLVLANEIAAARWLGAETYGLYALAVALAKIAEKLSVFGLHVAVLRFVPPQHERGAWGELAATLRAALLVPAAIGVVFALAVSAAAPWLAMRAFAKPELAPFIVGAAWSVPAYALCEVLGNAARALGRIHYYVVARILVPQVLLLALLGACATFEAPAVAAPWAFAASGLAGVIAAAALAWRACPPDARHALLRGVSMGTVPSASTPAPHRHRVNSAVYSHAWPVFFNSLLYMLIAWTDLLLLGALASATAVGLYRACAQIVSGFDMISVAFNAASARRFALAGNVGAPGGALQAPYAGALRGLLMLATPAWVALLLEPRGALVLMGPSFLPAALPLAVLASAAYAQCAFSIAAFLLVMTGRERLETANCVAAAALNVALNLWWIPRWGLAGAAAATATSLALLNVLRVAQVWREFRVQAIDAQGLRIVVVAVVPAALAHALASAAAARLWPEGTAPVLLPTALAAAAALAGYAGVSISVLRGHRSPPPLRA